MGQLPIKIRQKNSQHKALTNNLKAFSTCQLAIYQQIYTYPITL